MHEFFIKMVDAPGLIHIVGDEVPVEFSYRARNQCDRFGKCDGFLLYETGRKHEGGIGSKCIFAKGHIKIPVKIKLSDCCVDGKKFPVAIETIIDQTLPSGQHNNGLNIEDIRKIYPNFIPGQKCGGLFPIGKEQFEALSAELENRINKI